MLKTRGYAASGPGAGLEPFTFERREPGPRDAPIEIQYCALCASAANNLCSMLKIELTARRQ